MIEHFFADKENPVADKTQSGKTFLPPGPESEKEVHAIRAHCHLPPVFSIRLPTSKTTFSSMDPLLRG